MKLSVDALELLWLVLNLSAFVLTYSAYIDAKADQRAVRLLNGSARELAANGVVRRELLRLWVQALLIAVVVPSLVEPSPVPSWYYAVILMAIPIVLLLSTLLDARDRRAMTVLVTSDLLAESQTALSRIEEKLDKNTEISQGAREDAHEAAEVANHMNEKIKVVGDALLIQGKALTHDDEARAQGARVEATVDETLEKVTDLHDRPT